MWLCANLLSYVPFNEPLSGGCFLLNRVHAYSFVIAFHVICSQHLRSTNYKCTHACFIFHTTYVVQKMVKMWSTSVKSSSSWSSYLLTACGVLRIFWESVLVLDVIRQYTLKIMYSNHDTGLYLNFYNSSRMCENLILAHIRWASGLTLKIGCDRMLSESC
jgi:hypothetical protein